MEIQNSSPPLSKPHPPQNSEVQPFPLPVLHSSGHSSGRKVGGTMGRIYRQQVGHLYRPKWVQDPIQVSSIPIGSLDKSESILHPLISRRDRRTSQEMGNRKGTESGNSQLLFPAIPSAKKELKVTPSNKSFVTKSVYKQTAFQDGVSQVSKTIDNGQQLGCLHRSDECIFSCIDTSDIQKIPSVHLRTSGLSVHGLTLRNVPKSVDFHEINGSNSSSLMTMTLPIPRRLAYLIHN